MTEPHTSPAPPRGRSRALCGGAVEPGSLVNEDWLLALERKHFVELAKMPKTQERIEYMLKNGKPLRN